MASGSVHSEKSPIAREAPAGAESVIQSYKRIDIEALIRI
jgi:hypothetical protein